MRPLAIVVLVLVLNACGSVLPTLEVTNSMPTQKTVTVTVSPSVTIVGNVNLRDDKGVVVGWLARGEIVQAVCEGTWCLLSDNTMFWRGCGSDNPANLGCLDAE